MGKSKINVISKETNQGHNGLKDVTHSTNVDASEAMNNLNVQILGNNFEVDCKESVSKPVRKHLEDFLSNPQRLYPDLICKLNPGDNIAFEIKRENRLFSKNPGKLSATGMAGSLVEIYKNFYGNKDLKSGEIVTVINVIRDRDNPNLLHISEEKIEAIYVDQYHPLKSLYNCY